MLLIGIVLAILSALGFLTLLVEWIGRSRRDRAGAARKQREQQRQNIISVGLKRAAQAKKEAEQIEQQAIQDEYRQLQVNLAALDAEIQALQDTIDFLTQQGLEIPEQVGLFLQKQRLERRLVELDMQGTTSVSLYDDIACRIERIEAQLEIVERGETARLVIEQQAEIKECLEQLAQKQAITFEELRKDLEKRFTPAEVQNILLRAGNTAREIMAMTAVALGSGKQRLSLKSP